MRLVFDIETDGLNYTKMYVLCTEDLDTGEKRTFLEGDMSWMDYMSKATQLIGHNIIAFDLVALHKLFGWKPSKKTFIVDTLLLSMILDFRRFGSDGHRLENWGKLLGNEKLSYSNFETGTATEDGTTVDVYCQQDVNLSCDVARYLFQEMKERCADAPNLNKYIEAEHYVATWCARAYEHGWWFDKEKALVLKERLEAEIQHAKDTLESRLGVKAVLRDKYRDVVEPKLPKWKKDGTYAATTANWFGVDPYSGLPGEERMIEGPYSRVEFEPLSLTSVTDVKTFLFRNGWEPTEWNTKRNEETGKMEKTSPKIIDEDLELLGGDGQLYTNFRVASSRYAILKTWLENTDAENKLHGDCFVIGTPSMRMRHQIIANIPSDHSAYGKEFRELFTVPEGWLLIGCDSKGNQSRGLAFDIKDEDFTRENVSGDIHQHNANIMTKVLHQMGFVNDEVTRSASKRVYYASLFGASGAKLWSYVKGKTDNELGKRFKDEFIKAIPGFKDFLKRLEAIFAKTRLQSQDGYGYIPSIAGNRVYCESFHKLLVYRLQSTEKVTTAAGLMTAMKMMDAENIPYQPLIYYHDEYQFAIPESYKDRAMEIAEEAMHKGAQLFGIDFMEGEAKAGHNWLETH